ncbi:hypothetical protein [Luteitalea sp.]|jgi:hypothetical protein|uniref:hypothetical protein n=1 Tax=Luteitalea sp. TaxID=2004800 RepID=UPI0037CC44CD
MLRGIQIGVLTKLQPVSIHGQVSYDIHYVKADDEDLVPQVARVGGEDIAPGLHPGDRVKLHILLNQVTKVERDG